MRTKLASLLLIVVVVQANRARGHGFGLTLTTSGGIPSSIESFAEFPGNYMDSSTINSAPGDLFYAPFSATSGSNGLGAYFPVIHGSPYTAGPWPSFTATYAVISPLYYSDGVGTLCNGTGPAAAAPASPGTFMTVFDRDIGIFPGASPGTVTFSGTTSFAAGFGISLDDPHELQKNLYVVSGSTQNYGEYGFAYEVTVTFSGGQTLTTGPLVDVFPLSDPNFGGGDFSDYAPYIQQDEATLAIFNAAIKTLATWNTSGSGSFNDYTKWTTSAVPSGPGQTVVINAPLESPTTITLDAVQTMGYLTLGNTASNSAGYTLASGTLANGNPGNLVINNLDTCGRIIVSGGSNAITADMVLANNLTITPSAGTTLFISGNISQSSAAEALTLCGPGTLVLSGSNSYTGGTIVSDGTLYVLDPTALSDGSALTVGANAAMAFAGPAEQESPEETASRTGFSAVPEPRMASLLLLAGAVMLFSRLRRGSSRLLQIIRPPV